MLEFQALGDRERRGRAAEESQHDHDRQDTRHGSASLDGPTQAIRRYGGGRSGRPAPTPRTLTPTPIAATTSTTSLCGKSSSLIPLSSSTDASAARSVRSGIRSVNWLENSTPGNRADQQPADRAQVDVAGDEVAETGDPEQRGRVEDVGADHLRRAQREDDQHRQPEEDARADRGQADDEAAEEADRDRGEPSRRVSRNGSSLRSVS